MVEWRHELETELRLATTRFPVIASDAVVDDPAKHRVIIVVCHVVLFLLVVLLLLSGFLTDVSNKNANDGVGTSTSLSS